MTQDSLFAPRRHAGTLLGFEPAPPVTPPAEHLHRADDQGGSIAAAARAVETGRAETEARLVLEALRLHPGATRAELAKWTAAAFAPRAGQAADEWAYTCGRRLSGLEDRGLVRAIANRPSVRRPWREVDPNVAPCTVSPGAPQSLRWWPKEES